MKRQKLKIRFSIRSLLLLTLISALAIVGYRIFNPPDLNASLLQAMQADRPVAIAFYLWLGADPDDGVKGKFGYYATPLQKACWRGHSTLARHLIAAGANIDYQEGDGFTAIVYAADEGLWDIVQVLHEAGADHLAVGADGKSVIDYAKAAGRDDIVEMLTQPRNN